MKAISIQSLRSAAVEDIYSRFPRNPFNHRQIFICDGDHNFLALVLATHNVDGGVYLSEISTIDGGKGNASRALKAICLLADKYRETIMVVAKRIGESQQALTSQQLRAWYARHGFVCHGGNEYAGYEMVRPALAGERNFNQ